MCIITLNTPDDTNKSNKVRINEYDTIVISNTKRVTSFTPTYSNQSFTLLVSKTPEKVYNIIKEIQPECTAILQQASPKPKRIKDPTILVDVVNQYIRKELPHNYKGFYVLVSNQPVNYTLLSLAYNNTKYPIAKATLNKLHQLYKDIFNDETILLIPIKHKHRIDPTATNFIPYALERLQTHINNNKEKFTPIHTSRDLTTSYSLNAHATSALNSELWRLLAEEKSKPNKDYIEIPSSIAEMGLILPQPIIEVNEELELYRPLTQVSSWIDLSPILNKIK